MRKFCFVFILIFYSGIAFAASDLIATYKYSDGNMLTICVRDNNHVRMDTSETSYMLMNTNKIYSVSKDGDGKWHVMDMDKMKSMMAGAKSMFGGGHQDEYSVDLKKTGRSETIAGYKGTVYAYEMFENGARTHRGEMVLSRHSDVEKVNQAWRALMSKTGAAMGQDMTRMIEQTTKDIGDKGLLRYDQEMTLLSLKKMSLDSAYYELPGNAEQVEFRQPPSHAMQPDQPGMMEQDARDVGQAARGEAKDATIDEVREGVRGLFNSLFD